MDIFAVTKLYQLSLIKPISPIAFYRVKPCRAGMTQMALEPRVVVRKSKSLWQSKIIKDNLNSSLGGGDNVPPFFPSSVYPC